jgi:hypothetical protein
VGTHPGEPVGPEAGRVGVEEGADGALLAVEMVFVIQTATTRPTKLGQPFTRWSIRKLAAYLRRVHGRVVRIGREALRCLLRRRGITFQRAKTWKEFPDPERDAKLDRIEHVLEPADPAACGRPTTGTAG